MPFQGENLKQGFWVERSQVQHNRECVSNSHDFMQSQTGQQNLHGCADAARPVARIDRISATATAFASAPPSFDRHPRRENLFFLPLCSSCPPAAPVKFIIHTSASERTLPRKATCRICGQPNGCCCFSLTPPNQLEPALSLSSLLSSPSLTAAEPIK